MKIIGNEALFFSDTFKELSVLLAFYDATPEKLSDGRLSVEIDSNHPAVTIMLVLGWVQSGGEIEEFPAFLAMSDEVYDQEVPAGIPNRSYTDENDTEVVRKWSEWKAANHTHRTENGIHYVPTNGFGVDLKGTELAVLVNHYSINITGATIAATSSDIRILTAAEYNDAMPVSEVE